MLNNVGILVSFNDFVVMNNVFKNVDAGFHLALLVFGCVVVPVFGEVSQGSCGLDNTGDFRSTHRRQVVPLVTELVERRLRNAVYLTRHINLVR